MVAFGLTPLTWKKNRLFGLSHSICNTYDCPITAGPKSFSCSESTDEHNGLAQRKICARSRKPVPASVGTRLRKIKAWTSLVAPPVKEEPLVKKEPRSPARLDVVADVLPAQSAALALETFTRACRAVMAVVFLANAKPNAEEVRPLLELGLPNAR